MKDLKDKAVHLYSLLIEDLIALTDEPSLVRDAVTIIHRSTHEGLPFLTRTLPKFGDNFFTSLNEGTFQPLSAFKQKGALPKFLYGLTSRVFDADTGDLLEDPCYVAAYAIRQLCYLLYKMEMPYSDEMSTTAVNKVVETDNILDESVTLDPFDKVLLLAESLISEVLGPFSWEDTIPRHGPGASSHRIDRPWQKYHFWDDGTEVLPDEYFTTPGLEPTAVCCRAYDLETRLGLTAHTVQNMSQSKLSLVPKNSKGPRTISGEAVRRMWAQLGLDYLIRKRVAAHSYSRNSINLTDQTVNARLALESSKSGRRATLDLSEASDRISMKLISWVLPVEWFQAICRIRSTEMRLPSGDPLVLSKVSPMGNGFTFSLESLVFWAITSATIAHSMEEAYTSEDDLKWACQNTFVYGDDIIIPVEYTEKVMSSLERYGFRINRDKSFWAGPFRESCGTDAFNGVDVTPLKIKAPPQMHSKRKNVDATFVSSWFEQANTWKSLLPKTCAWMKNEIYAGIGFKPTYPAGWEGCIGEPSPSFETAHGRPVEVGERRVPGIQKVIRGPLRYVKTKKGRAKSPGFVWIREDRVAPSAGKLIKVVRIESVRLRAPVDEFPEELAYLRWLQSNAGRVALDEPFDARTFTLRYTSKVSIRREWYS